MSRKKRFVEPLTETEVITLAQGYKYGKAVDFRERCQTLLLSHRGYEVKQIADVLKLSAQTIYTTLNSWEGQGLAGIIRKKGQGRKATLQLDNVRHVEAVHKAVNKHAQSSTQMLEALYAELDIAPMSKRSLLRFLKKMATAGSDSADGSRTSPRLKNWQEK